MTNQPGYKTHDTGFKIEPTGDDMEDWETGIETKYSVKSITYVGGQPVPTTKLYEQSAAALSKSPHKSAAAVRSTEPDMNSATNSLWGFIKATMKVEGKYLDKPPDVDDSDSDEGYKPNIPITEASHQHVSIKQDNLGCVAKQNTCDVGLPPEEYDSGSDNECHGWDFGGKSKTVVKVSNVDSNKSKEIGISELIHINPGVCVPWLKSILRHSGSGSKSGNTTSRTNEPKLWPLTNVFDGDMQRVCESWLGDLQMSWSMDGANKLNELINKCFSSVENPYATALYLIESAMDYKHIKPASLSHNIVREFERWTRLNPLSIEVLKRSEKAMQIYAFYVGTRYHMTSFDFIVKAFRLANLQNMFLIEFIQPFIHLGKLKEACHCVGRLGLHEHFNTEAMLLPLILQDKLNIVEQYVFQQQKQQVELLQLLDRLCQENVNLNKLAEDSGVKDIRYNKLDRKVIGKLAVRLMKLYQIPSGVCPNVDRRRNLSAMRFMFYKFYIEESVSRETWRELVAPTVAGNLWLQERLLEELMIYNDVSEAVWWVRHCQMPEDVLPSTVIQALEDGCGPPPVSVEPNNEDWNDVAKNYLQLKVPLSEVLVIDTRKDFIETIQYIVTNSDILGLDAEWRPSMGRGTRVALLQMAIRTRVFLLDVIALCLVLSESDWVWFGEHIFLNPAIVKLGYGFEGDVQMMSASIPVLKEPIVKAQRMIELEKLHHQVRKNPEAFRSKELVAGAEGAMKVLKSDERGLSGMVRHCLGQPLDKSEQMSDWEKRPLRVAQLVYAAMDAHVLIALYEHVVECAGMLEVPMALEPQVSMKQQAHRSRMEKRQTRVAGRTEEQIQAAQCMSQPVAPVCGPPIRPFELAVVVDTMIQGVGRYLRSCGVDTRILDSSDDHGAAVVYAVRENRVILTCGQPYLSMRTQVPEGMCYNVSTFEKARKQAIDILDHFNVMVTEEDIFSRCQMCNGREYLYVSPDEMRRAWDRRMHLVTKHGRQLPAFRPATSPGNKTSANTTRTRKCPIHVSIRDPDFSWDHINMDDVTIGNGVLLQIGVIPRDVTHQVELFFVCATCGKVFWEGKHFSSICEQFSEVLNRSKRMSDANKANVGLVAAGIKQMLTFKT